MPRTTDPMADASSSTGITTSGTSGELTTDVASTDGRVGALPVLLGVVVLVAAAHLVGRSSLVSNLSLGAEPFIGSYRFGLGFRALAPASVAVVLVALAPVAIERLPWRALLLVGWASSALYAVALAAVDGSDAVAEPLSGPLEYRAVLDDIDAVGVGTFVHDFVHRLPSFPTHVRGHPVGAPLVFWFHEQLGLTGPGWSAALVVALGTSVVVSVAVVTRLVAGETVARRVLPFVAVTPALVWTATSADALFSGVVAACVALFAVASARHDLFGDALAVLAGAVGALALHLTYGAVVMLLVAAVLVTTGMRRIRPLLVGCVGAAAVTLAFTAAGFWWFAGLAATRLEYLSGAGGERPFWYFAALANPAAFAVAIGPAVVVALVRLRDRRLWSVVGGAAAGVVLADLSGMSKAEVERIWLPFVPWLSVAAAVLPRGGLRPWLAAQAGVALVVQLVLDSPW